jgi:hypothetical protein
MNSYTVKYGETINDVAINATGTVKNVPLIIEYNNITNWNATLPVGSVIYIPDTVETQKNVLRSVEIYPTCNNSTTSTNNEITQLITNFV